MVFKVYEDNEGAKALPENPLSSARTKHIDVRYHFLEEVREEEGGCDSP